MLGFTLIAKDHHHQLAKVLMLWCLVWVDVVLHLLVPGEWRIWVIRAWVVVRWVMEGKWKWKWGNHGKFSYSMNMSKREMMGIIRFRWAFVGGVGRCIWGGIVIVMGWFHSFFFVTGFSKDRPAIFQI